jgi:hypothetical protein
LRFVPRIEQVEIEHGEVVGRRRVREDPHDRDEDETDGDGQRRRDEGALREAATRSSR